MLTRPPQQPRSAWSRPNEEEPAPVIYVDRQGRAAPIDEREGDQLQRRGQLLRQSHCN